MHYFVITSIIRSILFLNYHLRVGNNYLLVVCAFLYFSSNSRFSREIKINVINQLPQIAIAI